jgi:hypothetical protein
MLVRAYTATIPQRVSTLKMSIESILPQVDYIQVVLNNFKNVPSFLRHEKITTILGDNSLEDGSRFTNIATSGYVLVFDDDIQYPSDYVSTMIEHCKRLNAIVTPMGKILKARPLESYYKGWLHNYRTFDEVIGFHKVDIPGACGVMWTADQVKVTQGIITKQVHHSDICLGKFAKENHVNCFVVPHSGDWLKNLMPLIPKSPSIYRKYKNNDKILTDFVNQHL